MWKKLTQNTREVDDGELSLTLEDMFQKNCCLSAYFKCLLDTIYCLLMDGALPCCTVRPLLAVELHLVFRVHFLSKGIIF